MLIKLSTDCSSSLSLSISPTVQDCGNNSLKGGNTNIQMKPKNKGGNTNIQMKPKHRVKQQLYVYSCTAVMFTVNFCQPTHTCSTSSLWTAFCHQTHQMVHSHTQSDTPQHSHVFKMSAVSALKRNYITSTARATCNNADFLFLLLSSHFSLLVFTSGSIFAHRYCQCGCEASESSAGCVGRWWCSDYRPFPQKLDSYCGWRGR